MRSGVLAHKCSRERDIDICLVSKFIQSAFSRIEGGRGGDLHICEGQNGHRRCKLGNVLYTSTARHS